MRRDRRPTITVHADPALACPAICSTACGRKSRKSRCGGYLFEWGGEDEDCRLARAALAKPLPAALLPMVLIVVCLFNSIRSTLVICLAVPLAIVGVTAGLLLIGQPFGFMALLGVTSLEELEALEKIADKIEKITVVGGLNAQLERTITLHAE